MPEPGIYSQQTLQRERPLNPERKMDWNHISYGAEAYGNKYQDKASGQNEQQDSFATPNNQSRLNPPNIRYENGAVGQANAYLRQILKKANIDVSIVADGVGSSKEGKEAARRAVVLVSEFLYSYLEEFQADPINLLGEAVEYANDELIIENRRSGGGRNTTIAISALDRARNRVFTANVGDSNIYLLPAGGDSSGRQWKKLSLSDCKPDRDYRNGLISYKEAQNSSQRNYILQNLGSPLGYNNGEGGIHLHQLNVMPGDKIIAMTDGVEDGIGGESQIPGLLRDYQPQRDQQRKMRGRTARRASRRGFLGRRLSHTPRRQINTRSLSEKLVRIANQNPREHWKDNMACTTTIV